MERWNGKVALVTGASAGIGAEIAKQLVKHGLEVYGIARRLDRLEALAAELAEESGKFYPVQCDMTKEEDILATFDLIKENSGGVDVLINNAAILVSASLMDGDTALWRHSLETNLLGLCITSREAIKSMKEREFDGHIIHINSIVGHGVPAFAGPYLNIYPATKNAVTALAESLRQEFLMHKCKIKISNLSPGIVATDIFEVGGLMECRNLLGQIRVLDPIDCADAVLYMLSTPPHSLVSELTIRPVEAP